MKLSRHNLRASNHAVSITYSSQTRTVSFGPKRTVDVWGDSRPIPDAQRCAATLTTLPQPKSFDPASSNPRRIMDLQRHTSATPHKTNALSPRTYRGEGGHSPLVTPHSTVDAHAGGRLAEWTRRPATAGAAEDM